MNNNWYMTKLLATAHTNDLLAAADRHRLARQAQTRRWSLTRQVRVENEPAAARRPVATTGTRATTTTGTRATTAAPSCRA